ncbi:hypothetical protein SERLADRAFT_375017 [Serpula lacrymans var. lacrymans S7.9]|uniref:Uncharacterized protein n=1 Tax=Serpula lacrymans var. lacrymans (strain S7.9) TaxID=578457 RepID=F8PE12_SERL9|nr:uncharacterized protein SERLADRAFT_375017 [Serpula lacrymans var. lacrymans S7.9]EGO18609.1 hypothetical protein SERLADRAFT_375017 [Serpula lacrymans var. lacrymans S7.9]
MNDRARASWHARWVDHREPSNLVFTMIHTRHRGMRKMSELCALTSAALMTMDVMSPC